MTQANHSQLLRPVLSFLAAAAISAHAAIPVADVTGTGVLTFEALPPTTEWSSRHVLPNNGGVIADHATLNTAVQTNNASGVNAAVVSATGAANNQSAWHSTSRFLYTRPTGNSYQLLMGQFVNNIGSDASGITLSFDVTKFSPAAQVGTVVGWNVYYSLSGLPGEWVLIPQLSAYETNGQMNATVTFANNWLAGSVLYVLFADDNAVDITDQGYSIDNFLLTAQSAVVTCADIVTGPSNQTVPERGAANLTIGATGSPLNVQWFRSDDGGANYNPVLGANSTTYTIPSTVYPGDNGARFYATVSNSLCQETSTVAIVTVQPDVVAPYVIRALRDVNPTNIFLTFSEPMHPDNITEANFAVFPTGGDPFANGILVYTAVLAPDGTNVTLTTEEPVPLTDFSVQVFDVVDASFNRNTIDPNPATYALPAQQLLIGFDVNNEWKYFVSTTTDLWTTAPDWATVNYDDSAWSSGPAGLGADTSANGVPVRTITPFSGQLPDGQRFSEPSFHRRHFFLPSGTNGLTITMRHVFEDGAVVFINGQEAGRYNVAANTVLNFAARAAGTAQDPTPISAPVTIPLTNVVPGDNVIAVLVLQSGNTSTDAEMALELVATINKFASGPPNITTDPQTQTVDEGQDVSLTVVSDGEVPLSYHWSKGSVPIPSATGPTLTITDAIPDNSGSYSVIVSNALGIDTSASAMLTVVPDTISPTFISAVASTNLTNILLTIVDNYALNPDTIEESGNYSIELVGGGGALAVETAVLVNATNVLVTTTPRTQNQDYTITLTDITDRAVAGNPVTPSTKRVVSEIIVLTPNDGTLWKYETASNNLDGLTWYAPGFDVSLWPQAVAGFTTSNNLETTDPGFEVLTTNMLSTSVGGPITAYYRVNFNFPGTVANATLQLVGVVDDGLVAYINGVEAGRLRVTNASPVSFTNLATAASPETTDFHNTESIVLTNLSALVPGNNLLAIELHQNSANSSDAVLSVQIVAGTDDFADVGPKLNISYNGGQVTITWTGGGVLQETTQLLNGGATVWTDVPGNPGSPYTFTATGEKKFYSLRP